MRKLSNMGPNYKEGKSIISKSKTSVVQHRAFCKLFTQSFETTFVFLFGMQKVLGIFFYFTVKIFGLFEIIVQGFFFWYIKVKCFLYYVLFPIVCISYIWIKIPVENDKKEDVRLSLPAPESLLQNLPCYLLCYSSMKLGQKSSSLAQ